MRFDDETLRILESVLVSKDVKSLIETRSRLKEFMRSESVTILKLNEKETVDRKLNVAEFFVRAFALVGDTESCLALKYEALILRELKYMNHPCLQVSYEEWLTFAEDCCCNGFYSIAIKGFDNAIECLQHISVGDKVTGEVIKERWDKVRVLIGSRSVQAETAKYLKNRALLKKPENEFQPPKTQALASSMFRCGNLQRLQISQKRKINSS
ncbi:hypothetical protein H6P81_016495 [Aristolochia fimbriata]|uniref:Uncharacterized protein n=1 Tax=Aristolochia fimbriata TaxID=158543 RepID=A0AAV7E8E8_ARIFI|nr:hypothetical protein H6P81_016495 [Aristolochia fimbriata]